MPKFKPATAKTVADVVMRLADLIREEPPEARRVWAEQINEFLDDRLGEDAFGTEGQIDPRGDHRD